LPLFKRCEHHERGSTPYHGVGGPLNVADQRSSNLLTRVYVKAGQQAGYRYNDDFSGAEQEGIGPYQLTQKNGERWSVARAYLHPVRKRPNLTVITGAHASRVLLDGKRAVGVAYSKDGKDLELQARREVILAGGAINSPQLLMLSGIGPAEQLTRHGIPVRHALPGVGKNLQDHLDVLVVHQCSKAVSLGVSVRNLLSPLVQFFNYVLFRKGAFTSNAAEGGGFIRSDPALAAPDLQLHFTPAHLDDHGHTLSRAAYTLFGHGYALHVCDLRPKSRGEIRLASADPAAPALIDPNYLSHPEDMASLVRGVKAARKVLAAPAFDPYRGVELFPGPAVQDDAAIEAFIRRKAGTIYHPVGTCKMGHDPMAVVDAQLCVHGMTGLRVVDASIMPTLIGGNTNAPTVMIAEKAADMILGHPAPLPGGGVPRATAMQRTLWRWCAAFLLLLLGTAAFASAPGELRFEQLNAESGLPHASVTALLQDRDGFMWFAGQGGLSRYDGYRFLTYKNDPADPNSISDNSVQALHQDRRGQLWVGTRNGLQRYHPGTDNFSSALKHAASEHKGDYYDVRNIASDADDVLWLTTRTGLVRFDAARNQPTFFRHQTDDSSSLASNDVSALVFDAAGGLWIGTGVGVDYLARGSAGFVHFPVDARAGADPRRNAVKVIALGPDDSLWVGTPVGLEIWQLRNGAPVSRRALGAAEDFPASPVTALFRDNRGTMWVGTQSAGLLRWDAQRGRFSASVHQPGKQASLADNFVSSMFHDRSGILWIGTWFGGASRIDLTGGGFRHIVAAVPGETGGLSTNKITAILGAGPGQLWLGSYGGGVNLLDVQSGKVTVYRHQAGVAGSLNDDLTTALGRDAAGQLWVGTRNGGLSRFDPASGRFTPRPFATGDDAAEFIQAIVPDRKGILWVASRGGLHRLDTRTNQALTYRHDAEDESSLADDFVWTVLDDSKGRLWVATSNGLDLLDRATGRFTHVRLSHNRISYLHESGDGSLWVGTGGGLNRITTGPDGALTVRMWLARDGLLNPAVNGILEDDQQQLWISTEGGIVNFDPASGQFRNYTGRDGMAEGDYFVGSAYRMPDGVMAFGSFNNGLTLLHPSAVRGNPVAPQVRITDFLIFNESVRHGRARAGFSLDGPIQNARHAVLSYKDAMFSLEFAALHFGDPRRNAYRYQLEGVDKEWVTTDAGKRFASYTNLAPGDYVFRVTASNKDGVWNDAGTSLAIRITPPFWATWWFRIAAAALLLSAIAAAYRMRVRALVGQKLQLEREVAQRTSEVVQQKESVELEKARAELAYKQLASAQEKLVLNEKMAALGTLSAGIAHEINNPTNYAHAGAQLMADDLERFRLFLMDLAGPDAAPKVRASLEARFAALAQQLATITDGTARIRALVKDLGTFSRMDDGEKKPMRIGAGLQSTVRLVRTLYSRVAHIDCMLEVDPLVNGRAAQLNQVFMNLIVNACQAIEAKRSGDGVPGTLTIRSRIAGATLCVDFRDTGAGIDDAVIGRIYDPFFTTKPTGEGTGLGLSISFGIIEQHQGSLRVRSVAGEGSCFTVCLPLA
ncbi:MAG TPA: two-component regulator propeller domain-containing protein, partial [Telluria sp.]